MPVSLYNCSRESYVYIRIPRTLHLGFIMLLGAPSLSLIRRHIHACELVQLFPGVLCLYAHS
jgi:hypothetical protein